ncbi:MAG: antibiotic biosynthesis monooxygenase [Bacteroidota bacterium]
MNKFIVLTRTFFEASIKEEVMEMAHQSLPIFKAQKGLISIKMHLDSEGKHTMTYFEWETQEDHEACTQSPDFGEWNTKWGELMASGKLTWDLNAYEIIDEG